MIALVASFVHFNSFKKSNNMSLRIGYEFNQPTRILDPAKIVDIYQSNLIENLFSRIVEFDSNGDLVCVLCKKFWIEGNYIYFQFHDNLKTVDGYLISAQDAEFSLRRLIRLNTNTHGNIETFIDLNDKFSILSKENILSLKLKKSHYSQFVIPLLASMDFSVIPEKSILKDKDGEYLDLRNTSGPYFLNLVKNNHHLELKANHSSPLFSEGMFKVVEIVPIVYGEGVDAFLENKIDVLDVTYYPGYPQYEKLFSQKIKKFSTHKTILMNMFLLNINPNALKKFSSIEMFNAARTVSEAFLSFKRYGYGMERSIEFFQANGAGLLSQYQKDEIEQKRNEKLNVFNVKKVVLGVEKDSYERIKNALKDKEEIEVKSFDVFPGFLAIEERPDIFMQVTDSSFNEDISLLGYNFSQEYFGLSKSEGKAWLAEFIEILNKEDRIKKLQDFQFEILKKPYVYPIGASPYWAISNEDLILNYSENFPGSSWWKIRKK